MKNTKNKREILIKDNPLPLYYQLYLLLKNDIENGKYPIGDKIPSEAELKTIYNTSRVTIRQALEMLKDEGFIETKKGIGSFVKEYPQPIFHNFSLPVNYKDTFNALFNRSILRKSIIPSIPEINKLLMIDEDRELVYLERLFTKDGKVIAFNCSYLNSEKYADLLDTDFIENRLSVTLAEKFGVEFSTIKNTINAILMDDKMMELFKLDYLTPALEVTSISYSNDDNPVEYSKTIWLGSAVKLYVNY